MRTSMRPMNTVTTVAVAAAMVAGVAGCSRSYDTTQVDAVGQSNRQAAPTTSIILETIPPSTVMELQPLRASTSDLQGTLTQLISGFANDPDLVAAVKALNDGDLASIAALLDIDLGALSSLGLSVGDIASLGDSVLGDRAGLLALLGGLTGGGGPGGALDPATLIGILANSLKFNEIDLNGLAEAAVPQLITALFGALQGAQLVFTPEILIQLDDMLERIDPNAFDEFIVDEANAPLVALITSVILGNSPLLQQGVANNPNLDPGLRKLLKELEAINDELGETTSSNLFELWLKGLFPDLAG